MTDFRTILSFSSSTASYFHKAQVVVMHDPNSAAVISSFEQLVEITQGYAVARSAADAALCRAVQGGFLEAAKESIEEFYEESDPECTNPGVVFAAHASTKMIRQVEQMVALLQEDD